MKIVSEDELVGVDVHVLKSGLADLKYKNDAEMLLDTRRLMQFLPLNNHEKPPKYKNDIEMILDANEPMQFLSLNNHKKLPR